ncbi:MAG TPA: hypothetical protein VM580_29425 [Labilithrix sp.]|nr:hypothetical protein [Labilithrix sp.]
MPESANSFDFTCDWKFGLNLSPKKKATVGYLLFWSGAGGLNLTKDIEVWNPFDAAGQTVVTGDRITCVGLLESFRFEGGDDDPIRIVAYVSKGAAADVRAKLAKPLPSTKVKLVWYIISFDEERKAWYEAALIKDNAKADAILDTANGEVQWFIDSNGSRVSETLEIKVYRMEMQIVPAPGKTALLEFATGPAARLVKKWTG